MNKSEMTKELSNPFPAEAIDWRVGATNADKSKGIALAYLQARPVMDRLDEVVGPEGWQDAYVPIHGPNGLAGFICTLSLKIGSEWVSKTDGSDTSDVEPIKGGFSDSFKRAAVKWGIGRYLYDLPNTWYSIEPKGRSHVLKTTPTLPTWALPSSKSEPQAIKLEGKPLTMAEGNKMLGYEDEGATEQSPKEKTTDSSGTNSTQKLQDKTSTSATPLANPKYDLTTLDLSAALKTVDSDGKPFGDNSAEVLSRMATEYSKRLKLNGDDKAEAKYKLEAAKMIMKERANGSIK